MQQSPPARLVSNPRVRSLALVPLVLMVALPFLMPHHRQPIPTFFQEWWTIVLGLVCATALLSKTYREAFAIPRSALLPGVLGALIVAQMIAGPGTRSDHMLLALLYLGWAVLLMGLVRSLVRIHGDTAVARALTIGIALAAFGSAFIVGLQFTGSLRATGWISSPIGNRLFANLNQPNHLALLLWLGVAAILYLRGRRDLDFVTGAAAVAILAVISVLSGSRAVVAYALVVPVLAAWRDRRCQGDASTLATALVALAATLVTQLLFAWVAEPASTVTLAQREWGKDSDGIRTGLWWQALQMGLDRPLLGVGWGRFSSQTFAHLSEFRASAPASLVLVPAEHAHNVFLQLFAELGLAAPIALLGFGAAWILGAVRRTRSAEVDLAIMLMALLALHAQVEYTLWYAFFMGIAAIALALGDCSRLPMQAPGRLSVFIVIFASFATAAVLRIDYTHLENTMRWPLSDDGAKPRPWKEIGEELVSIRQHSRFSAYVDLVLVGSMNFDREHLAHKLTVCDSAIAFSPTDYAVFKCASLLALDGRRDAALDRLQRSMWAYPEKVAGYVVQVTTLARTYPELLPLADAARVFATERKLM